jgi:hypothetical protein
MYVPAVGLGTYVEVDVGHTAVLIIIELVYII